MSLAALLESLPAYAHDLQVNLASVLRQPELAPQQLWGTAVACAHAARNRPFFELIEREAQSHLSPVALEAAKTAAALMGMTNVYYRFQHLSSNPKYSSIPSRLRLKSSRTHGADPLDFDLWCLAVSALNNCAICVAAHEKILLANHYTEDMIVAALRIASVFHAVAVVMDVQDIQTDAGV